jgi:signal transduction histidine kinase
VAALRIVAFVWAAIAFGVSYDDLVRPVPAATLVVAAGVITAASVPRLVDPRRFPWPTPLLAVELAVGLALASGSGWAYGPGDPTSITTLGGIWPLAGVIGAGVAFGPLWGGLAGLAFGAARFVGTCDRVDGWPDGSEWWSVASTTILSVVAGTLVAATLRWVGRIEAQAAEAAAQERVARELHDGVLQSLAAIEARSTDPQVASLARAEGRRLRDHLFPQAEATTLDRALAERLATVEDTFGVRCELAVVEHVDLPPAVVLALAGAVGEAAVNAAKHGGVGCTVLVLPDGEGVSVSVHDEGPGFDPASLGARGEGGGQGLARSIRGRVEDVGGSVEVDSAPGRGCEVRLWIPFASS